MEVYDLQYFYDQVGNRSMKAENVTRRDTYYTYDTDLDPNDPSQWPGYPGEVYPTRNNRLLKCEEYDDSGVEPVLLRTVHYVYHETGDVSNIIVKDEYTGQGNEEDFDWYRGLAFTYWAYGGTTPGLALWEKWPAEHGWNPGPLTAEQGYEKLALREFRYHPNARGRFMVRDLDPNDPDWEWSTVGAERWTDYDIPMPNGDFDVTFDPNDVPVATESMRYLEGFGLPAQQTVSSAETRYFHGDLVRSTNLLTEGNGAAVATSAYTAFGELVGGDLDTRYRYAGGWGYESDLLVLEGAPGSVPITLMHAGARWYQPDIGRFIQRDPLGIFGGLNVYVYAVNDPVTLVDPHGLYPGDDAPPWPPGDREGRKAMRHFIRRWLRRWGLGGGMGTGVGAVLGKRKAKQLPLGGSQSSSVVVERIRMTLRLSSSGRVVYVLRIGARAVGWVGFAVDACVLASDLYRDMTDPGWDADPDDW